MITVDCSCCGYFSLKEGLHGEICPICYWEYDSFVDYKISIPSGNNSGLTLDEARRNFDTFGACEERLVKHALPFEARNSYRHTNEDNNH